MNTVSKKNLDGILTFECTCGANAAVSAREGRNFILRHPKLCSERRNFTQPMAQKLLGSTVKESRVNRLEAIEKALRESGVLT